MWQFACCVDGWNKLHGEHKETPPEPEELEAAIVRFETAARRRAEQRAGG